TTALKRTGWRRAASSGVSARIAATFVKLGGASKASPAGPPTRKRKLMKGAASSCSPNACLIHRQNRVISQSRNNENTKPSTYENSRQHASKKECYSAWVYV